MQRVANAPLRISTIDLRVCQSWGYLLGGPYIKDCRIFGSTLGSADFGKLPFVAAPRHTLRLSGSSA